jgi:hypothetical protein
MTKAAVLEEIVGAPWDRQPRERDRMYRTFVAYRNMGAFNRSLRDLAAQLGCSATLLSNWSASYRWQERCQAWDDEQERLLQVELAEGRKEMVQRHTRTAQFIMGRLTARLVGDEASGLEPADVGALSFKDAAAVFDTAVKIERLSRGVPNEVRGVVGVEGQPPVRHEFVDGGQPVSSSGDDLVEFLHGLEDAGVVPPGTAAHAAVALAGDDPVDGDDAPEMAQGAPDLADEEPEPIEAS